MKVFNDFSLTLPVRYKGQAIRFAMEGGKPLFRHALGVSYLIVSRFWLWTIAGLLMAVLFALVANAFTGGSGGTVIQNMYVQLDRGEFEALQGKLSPRSEPAPPEPRRPEATPLSQVSLETETQPRTSLEADVESIEFALKFLEEEEASVEAKNYEEEFLVKKQVLVSKTLIAARVSRLDQLPNGELLTLNRRISDLFVDLVLSRIKVEPHVLRYFTDTTDLDKLETSLMEQVKYHVPASIKLAQSALETAYGRRIVNNNYFGIKDKSGRSPLTTTVEYYNERELQANASLVVKKEQVVRGGKSLYKCVVRDHFERYKTPWSSFRAHSVYLSSNERYSPLFVQGKSYEAWADKIGSTKFGGVGYATSPTYGELLKKIIRRYRLHLLDY